MSFKSASCLDCSLTRYLKEASELESDHERAVFAAVTLSYLGYFRSDQQPLDARNLQQLTEMLEERGEDSFPPEFQQRCMQCPSKVGCPVGKIILKG
jgi:hypothetical protein